MMEVPFHYQFRVIVIGDTMVGKSSLLKTFSDGTFGEMEPTVGVDFFSKVIQIRPKTHNHGSFSGHSNNRQLSSNSSSSHGMDDGIIIKLQIWDTAGQERFKSIVTSYYRNSVGIVLVYDVTNRDSYNHLIDWFTEARRHVEPNPPLPLRQTSQQASSSMSKPSKYPISSTPSVSPSKKDQEMSGDSNYSSPEISQNDSSFSSIYNTDNSNVSYNSLSDQHLRDRIEPYKMAYLVLGCKTDLDSQRQVSYEDGRAFADRYGFKFIETSSKLNYNVNKSFQILAEEIYDKISRCSRINRLHRTASGGHLTFDSLSSQINEGIRLGPLIEGNTQHYSIRDGTRLLEAQPVTGFLGGCC